MFNPISSIIAGKEFISVMSVQTNGDNLSISQIPVQSSLTIIQIVDHIFYPINTSRLINIATEGSFTIYFSTINPSNGAFLNDDIHFVKGNGNWINIDKVNLILYFFT